MSLIWIFASTTDEKDGYRCAPSSFLLYHRTVRSFKLCRFLSIRNTDTSSYFRNFQRFPTETDLHYSSHEDSFLTKQEKNEGFLTTARPAWLQKGWARGFSGGWGCPPTPKPLQNVGGLGLYFLRVLSYNAFEKFAP